MLDRRGENRVDALDEGGDARGLAGRFLLLPSAPDLLVDVLGIAGKHTRAALGTNALPFNVTIEIAAVAVVRTR